MRALFGLCAGNAGRNALGLKGGAVIAGIVSLVGDHNRTGSFGQNGIEDFGPDMIGDLACRQAHCNRPTLTVTHGMQLGIQSALCPANVAGKNPPFMRLDAVR